jgi:hypothetical protein
MSTDTTPTTFNLSPKPQCLLLRLPRELRNEIYRELFSSTRLGFGAYYTQEDGWRVLHPRPYSLALLRSCHQIHDEIGLSWLSQVLFSFECPKAMMDKLWPLPSDKLGRIRFLRVRESEVRATHKTTGLCLCPELIWLLNNLQTLRLESLTVLDDRLAGAGFWTVSDLIGAGSEWKELRYISSYFNLLQPRPRLLAGMVQTPQMPQPSVWREIVADRDGSESGSSVTIYRANTAERGGMFDPLKRQVHEEVLKSEDLRYSRQFKRRSMSRTREFNKETLVVVKRGRMEAFERRNYYGWTFPQQEFPGCKDWAGIRRHCTVRFSHVQNDGIICTFDDSEEQCLVTDEYRDVDEYKWHHGTWRSPPARR